MLKASDVARIVIETGWLLLFIAIGVVFMNYLEAKKKVVQVNTCGFLEACQVSGGTLEPNYLSTKTEYHCVVEEDL